MSDPITRELHSLVDRVRKHATLEQLLDVKRSFLEVQARYEAQEATRSQAAPAPVPANTAATSKPPRSTTARRPDDLLALTATGRRALATRRA